MDDIYAVSIGYRKSYGRFGTFEPLGPLSVHLCRRTLHHKCLTGPRMYIWALRGAIMEQGFT